MQLLTIFQKLSNFSTSLLCTHQLFLSNLWKPFTIILYPAMRDFLTLCYLPPVEGGKERL